MKFYNLAANLLCLTAFAKDNVNLAEIEKSHGMYDKATIEDILTKVDFATVAEKMKFEMMQKMEGEEFSRML